MAKIAAQADVDISAVIQYIIQGIPGDCAAKTYLYEAQTMRDLRDRLVLYKRMKLGDQHQNKTNRKILKDGVGKRNGAMFIPIK